MGGIRKNGVVRDEYNLQEHWIHTSVDSCISLCTLLDFSVAAGNSISTTDCIRGISRLLEFGDFGYSSSCYILFWFKEYHGE